MITTRPATDDYRAGWERVFGKPKSGAPVIYKSVDDCRTFVPIEDAPRWLMKDREAVSRMMDGETVINHDETDLLSATYYRAKP